MTTSVGEAKMDEQVDKTDHNELDRSFVLQYLLQYLLPFCFALCFVFVSRLRGNILLAIGIGKGVGVLGLGAGVFGVSIVSTIVL